MFSDMMMAYSGTIAPPSLVSFPTTWDVASAGAGPWSFTNGNLTAVNTASPESSVRSVYSASAGKYHFRIKRDSGGVFRTGIAPLASYNGGNPAAITGAIFYDASGYKQKTGVGSTTIGPGVAVGSWLDVYVDLTAGNLWFGVDGTPIEGDPSAGTGASYTFTPGFYVVFCGKNALAIGATANFGQTATASPTGFLFGFGSTYANAYTNDAEAGNTTGWTTQSSATLSNSTAEAHTGSRSFLLSTPGNNQNGASLAISGLTVGVSYSFSFWSKRTVGASACTLRLGTSAFVGGIADFATPYGSWAQQASTFTAANSTVYFNIAGHATPDTPSSYHLDDIAITPI